VKGGNIEEEEGCQGGFMAEAAQELNLVLLRRDLLGRWGGMVSGASRHHVIPGSGA
jgi:hypothetical protein